MLVHMEDAARRSPGNGRRPGGPVVSAGLGMLIKILGPTRDAAVAQSVERLAVKWPQRPVGRPFESGRRRHPARIPQT